MKVKVGLAIKEQQVEGMEAKGNIKLDDDDAKNLLNPGGVLGQGNMPLGTMQLEGRTQAISCIIKKNEREKPKALP